MNIPAAFPQINRNFTQDPYRYVLSSYACFVLIIEYEKIFYIEFIEFVVCYLFPNYLMIKTSLKNIRTSIPFIFLKLKKNGSRISLDSLDC